MFAAGVTPKLLFTDLRKTPTEVACAISFLPGIQLTESTYPFCNLLPYFNQVCHFLTCYHCILHCATKPEQGDVREGDNGGPSGYPHIKPFETRWRGRVALFLPAESGGTLGNLTYSP